MKRAALIAALVCFAAGAAPGEEDASSRARTDADELVRNGLHQAERTLNEGGGLSPFALVMASDRRITRLQPAVRKDMPSPRELLGELEGELRDRVRAEDLLAVAVFSAVVIALPEGGESNALHATWEHRSGLCADLYVPYMQEDSLAGRKKEAVKGKLRFGERIERPRRASMVEHCESVPAAGAAGSADPSQTE